MQIFFFPLPRPFSRLVDGFKSVSFDFITNGKNSATRLPSRYKTPGLSVRSRRGRKVEGLYGNHVAVGPPG